MGPGEREGAVDMGGVVVSQSPRPNNMARSPWEGGSEGGMAGGAELSPPGGAGSVG